MNTKYEIVRDMFHVLNINSYFSADTRQKLHILLEATNHIMRTQEQKQRFVKEVTILSKYFAMAIPSEEAENIRDHVAFFQAVKARVNKFMPKDGMSDKQVDTAIRQIVEDALSTDGVIDIFQAA
jgi:type I restriction enzyme R subunit